MVKVAELTCDVCGQRRWGIDGSVCIMTLGCPGKLREKDHEEIQERTPTCCELGTCSEQLHIFG